MNAGGEDTQRRADLTAVVDELLRGWDEFVDASRLQTLGTGARRGRDRSMGQMAFVIGLVTHVHESARHLRQSMPGPLSVVHMPVVRAMYESTLTAVWCDEVDDGAAAKVTEHWRGRKNTRAAILDMNSFDASQVPPRDEIQRLASESVEQGKEFVKLCDEVALDGAYFYYRLMSSLSHASVEVADAYLDLGEDGHPEILARPKPAANDEWPYLTVVYCLIWSGMVANYYDPSRLRRNDLRRIAQGVGIAAELPVKASAVDHGSQRRHRASD